MDTPTPEQSPLDTFLARFLDPACLRAWADNLDDDELAGVPHLNDACPLAQYGTELAGHLLPNLEVSTWWRGGLVHIHWGGHGYLYSKGSTQDIPLPRVYRSIVRAVDQQEGSRRKRPKGSVITGAEFRRILDKVGITRGQV